MIRKKKTLQGKSCVQAVRDALAESRRLVVDRCNCTRLQRRAPRQRQWRDLVVEPDHVFSYSKMVPHGEKILGEGSLSFYSKFQTSPYLKRFQGLAGACKGLRSWSSHWAAACCSKSHMLRPLRQDPRLAFGWIFQRQHAVNGSYNGLDTALCLQKIRVWRQVRLE